MRTGPVGLALIKRFEGPAALEAYQDVAGIWTIGYGSTRNVYPGMVITSSEADVRLASDLEVAEFAVNKVVAEGRSLTQYQFDALVSLVFNIGAGAFEGSTLRRKLVAGDGYGAAMEFQRWRKAGGQVRNGLVRRRGCEEQLFLTPGGAS